MGLSETAAIINAFLTGGFNLFNQFQDRKQNEALGSFIGGEVPGVLPGTGQVDSSGQDRGLFGQLADTSTGRTIGLFGQNQEDFAGLRDQLTGNIASDTAEAGNVRQLLLGGFDQLLGGFNTRGQALQDRFKSRETDILGQLAGLGDQQRSNIKSDFESLRRTNQAALTNRGLAGTTLVQSTNQGTAREGQRALGNFEDQLRRNKIDVQSQLTADTLNNQSNFDLNRNLLDQSRLNLDTGLSENILNIGSTGRVNQLNLTSQEFAQREALSTGLTDFLNNLDLARIDFLSNININSPNQSNVLNSLSQSGFASIGPPSQPGLFESTIAPTLISNAVAPVGQIAAIPGNLALSGVNSGVNALTGLFTP